MTIAKKDPTWVTVLTDWKIVCSGIMATAGVAAFVYTQFTWKANLTAQQISQDNSIIEFRASQKQYEVNNERYKRDFNLNIKSIDEKLTSITNDVSEIRGELKIITTTKISSTLK